MQRNGTGSPGVLYAYDPTNSSERRAEGAVQQRPGGPRDTLDVAAKFTIPLVANGKVYVAGASSLTVYGLLP